MAARFEEIKSWVERAKANGAHHLVMVCDRYDHSDYPVEVHGDENVLDVIKAHDGTNMQEVMEVYDMSLSIDDQMSEHRAWHI